MNWVSLQKLDNTKSMHAETVYETDNAILQAAKRVYRVSNEIIHL